MSQIRMMVLRSTLCALCFSTAAAAQQITLKQAVELAQKQGYQARASVATRDAARARDRSFNRRLLPQISLEALAPQYDRAITPVVQPDGSTLFTPVQVMSPIDTMRSTMRKG